MSAEVYSSVRRLDNVNDIAALKHERRAQRQRHVSDVLPKAALAPSKSVVELSRIAAQRLRLKQRKSFNEVESQELDEYREVRRAQKRQIRASRRQEPEHAHTDDDTLSTSTNGATQQKKQKKKDENERKSDRLERKRQRQIDQGIVVESRDHQVIDDEHILQPPDIHGTDEANDADDRYVHSQVSSYDLPSLPLPSETLPVRSLSLSDSIVRALTALRIDTFFPTQSAVIPRIISRRDRHDICISSQTGSGKTLAYVVPIIQLLSQRLVTRLRAVILLPTRDLAIQVKRVVQHFATFAGLSVESAIGQSSFHVEQQKLIKQQRNAFDGTTSRTSRCDILVCTPGRLVDHIHETAGFSLADVEWFVADEADRLMAQSYNGWIEALQTALQHQNRHDDEESRRLIKPHRLCQILVSATLSNDPAKLAALNLHNPIVFAEQILAAQYTNATTSAQGKSLPKTLDSYTVECSADDKPLMLLHLLYSFDLRDSRVIIFTSAVETAHRLTILLRLYGGVAAAEYSSLHSQTDRSLIVRQLVAKRLSVLVCSDAFSRGMDVDGVTHVINYDVPNTVTTYVHRVGRTARAGEFGTAITLIKSSQFRKFKQILSAIANSTVKEYSLDRQALLISDRRYQQCLSALAERVSQERLGSVHANKPVEPIQSA